MADMTMKELQDTLAVVVGIQARQAELIKGHGEWLQQHDQAILDIRENGRRTDARIAEIGERIDKLVSGIGEFIRGESRQ